MRGIKLITLAAAVVSGSHCCEPLYALFPARTFLRTGREGLNNPQYQALNEARWSLTAIMNPTCIFRPVSVDEVSQAVKILTSRQCLFAIKSGGHMPAPGANSVNEGVSIDLSWLNQTTLSPDRRYVSLGAGGTWSNAYKNLEGDRVAIPGGVCGTTGIGGISIGGGESLFQPRVGWVVDNVLNYEIVLASGEITIANETMNADLYRALKGGGTNFGIVTRVDIATFEQSQLWAGQIVVPASSATVNDALLATTEFTSQNNVFINAGVQTIFINFANGSRVIDFGFGSTDGAINPKVLHPFTAMQPQILNTVKTRSLSNLVEEFDLVLPGGFRQLAATLTFINDIETIRAVQAVFDAVHDSIRHIPDMDWVVIYNPQPRVIESFSASRGGNVLGLEGVKDDQIVAFLTPRWLDASYDDIMFQAAELWIAEAKKVTEGLQTADPFLYVNFALASQKPFCGYGADNIQFLRETAKTYDPDSVFQTLVPGGFKISTTCD